MFASKDYLKKMGVPKTPEDLNQHHIITLGDDMINHHTNINWLLRVGLSPDSNRVPFMKLNSSECLLTAAKVGLGIVAIGSEHPKLAGVELEEVLPETEGPEIEIFYIYPEHLKNSKRVTILADYLTEVLSQK